MFGRDMNISYFVFLEHYQANRGVDECNGKVPLSWSFRREPTSRITTSNIRAKIKARSPKVTSILDFANT